MYWCHVGNWGFSTDPDWRGSNHPQTNSRGVWAVWAVVLEGVLLHCTRESKGEGSKRAMGGGVRANGIIISHNWHSASWQPCSSISSLSHHHSRLISILYCFISDWKSFPLWTFCHPRDWFHELCDCFTNFILLVGFVDFCFDVMCYTKLAASCFQSTSYAFG